MRTSRFKAEQVVDFLKQAEAGIPVREICIGNNISETTFYRWKEYYDGLGPNGIRRLRELEQENSRLRSELSVKDLEIDILRAERNRFLDSVSSRAASV